MWATAIRAKTIHGLRGCEQSAGVTVTESESGRVDIGSTVDIESDVDA